VCCCLGDSLSPFVLILCLSVLRTLSLSLVLGEPFRIFWITLNREHREHPRRRPRVGRSPDRLRHATRNLERRPRLRCGHCPSPWGLVGGHVVELEWPPPERHNTSGMVLPDNLRQGDPGVPKTPKHGLVGLEHLLFLCPGRAIYPIPLRLRDGAAGV
jgi:hypothetical protein